MRCSGLRRGSLRFKIIAHGGRQTPLSLCVWHPQAASLAYYELLSPTQCTTIESEYLCTVQNVMERCRSERRKQAR